MTTGRRVCVVLPPRSSAAAERDPLVAAAARLVPGSGVEVFAIAGAPAPADVAATVSSMLEGKEASLVLLPAGTEGEEIAALVAGRLGGCTLGRCRQLAIDGAAVVARRPVFGGRGELALRSEARVTCATARPEAFSDLPEPGSPVAPRVVELDVAAAAPLVVEPLPSPGSQPRVDGAAVVVSGGRGIGGAEGFALLERIAKALGAGLGGSLPAVDAGWVPVAHQVGQSGKFVAPKVYFAVGISGTPQHMAGISPQTRIVALNSDGEAPIFAHADVAVEGDWREILPLLAQALES